MFVCLKANSLLIIVLFIACATKHIMCNVYLHSNQMQSSQFS